jgi:hypothetical protein
LADERFVILLLDAGAPIDGLSNGDLMELVKSVAVFNRLVARGVNFTAMRDERGATLCHHVARNVTREDDSVFWSMSAATTPFTQWTTWLDTSSWASSSGNELAMRVMVELGAEIDRQATMGRLR